MTTRSSACHHVTNIRCTRGSDSSVSRWRWLLGRSAERFEVAAAVATVAAVTGIGRGQEGLKRGMAGSPREWMDGRVVSYQGRAGRLVALLPSARTARGCEGRKRGSSGLVLPAPNGRDGLEWSICRAVTSATHRACTLRFNDDVETVIEGVWFSQKESDK